MKTFTLDEAKIRYKLEISCRRGKIAEDLLQGNKTGHLIEEN